MSEQMTVQQTIIVSQDEINHNRTVEKKAFFNEDGEPVVVVNRNNEDYTEPELLSGWEEVVDPGLGIPTRPRYFKDSTGIVWIDFYAQTNGAWSAGFTSPAFTLPVGYRPDATIMRMGIWTSFSNLPEATPIMIFANGNVVVPAAPTDPLAIRFVAGISIRPLEV